MQAEPWSADSNAARGATIAEVSVALGVPMPTLRSWELRYGIPGLSRDRGRHRRYQPAEVQAIKLMRDEIARGRQAAGAADVVHQTLAIGGPAGSFIQQVLAGSEQLDTVAIRATLDEAAESLGLGDCVDEVLLPAMRQVGIWWEIGHCDIPQERTTTESVRAWLDRKIAFAPAPSHPRPILLACGPRDWHTIGLESMAMLLRHQGWPCRVLGARVSIDVAVTAARATDVAAVVVASQLATGRRMAVESIQALHRTGLPTFYAGNSFTATRSRVGVPGKYLGGRIQDACSQVIDALAAGKGLPAAG